MANQLTVTLQEYETLVALAREGTRNGDGSVTDKARELDLFLRSIEKRNNISRDGLWVQWQELDQPLPPKVRFPTTWPPELRKYIELTTRRVSKADVQAVLKAHASKPTNVMVTRDPGALVGWTTLDQYFLTG